ncbi:MAG: N4-gp56 family major capsid protein [Candidatus Daviesbacteria bacterium]|nr:N4-gp56 family major capsid protein [Candidatus Daviesbacteria bacterium]
MANTTRTEIPAETCYFYDRTLLERAVPLFVHTNFAQVRDIPQNSGTDSIKFRRYGTLTANTTALSEGVTPSGTQLSVTDVTATVLQYGDYVTITDKLQYETPDPILTEAADVLGEQAGDSIDQLCRDVLAAGTTIQYASSATTNATITSAMKLTRDEVKEAVRTLKSGNAKPLTSRIDPNTGYNTTPLNRCFIGIVSEDTAYDLDDATGWIPVEKYPNKGDVMPGEIGSLAGVRFIETTNAYVNSSAGYGSIDVHYTIILAQNAYAITRIGGMALRNIVKPLGSAGTADPLDQRATSGWKATFVAKILNQAFLVVIHHAVSS